MFDTKKRLDVAESKLSVLEAQVKYLLDQVAEVQKKTVEAPQDDDRPNMATILDEWLNGKEE